MRWLKFNAVGVGGMGVQLCSLAVLVHVFRMHYLPATALAVEAAILHNFLWHMKWTWSDRRDFGLGTLLRFNATAGVVSIPGNALLTFIFVSSGALDPVLGNFASILSLSLINFLVCDRFVFAYPRRGVGTLARVALIGSVFAAPVLGQDNVRLKPGAVEGFDQFVQSAETSMADRHDGEASFLWLAEDAQRLREALDGQVVVERLDADVDLDGAKVHNWIAGMFVPGATIDDVLGVFQDFEQYPEIYPEIIESEFLGTEGEVYKLYQRLRRKKVVTVVLDSWHDAQYRQLDEHRAVTWSKSTRINEVKNAGEPGEVLLPEGADGGYVWRLYLYWRLEQTADGVLAECHSISLSRNVPFLLKWLINPFVNGIPRESLERSLEATRLAVVGRGEMMPVDEDAR